MRAQPARPESDSESPPGPEPSRSVIPAVGWSTPGTKFWAPWGFYFFLRNVLQKWSLSDRAWPELARAAWCWSRLKLQLSLLSLGVLVMVGSDFLGFTFQSLDFTRFEAWRSGYSSSLVAHLTWGETLLCFLSVDCKRIKFQAWTQCKISPKLYLFHWF